MAEAQPLPTASEILDRFYAAERVFMSTPLSQRDFSGMAAHLSKDVKLYQSPDLPYGGIYEGHEGFLRCFEAMGRCFSALDVLEPRVFERGSEVVVLSTLQLTTRARGKEWAQPLCQVVRVDRQAGVITAMRPFYWDVKGLREAIGA